MTHPIVPLPQAMATFYDLPSAVPFRFHQVETTRPPLVRLDELARYLGSPDPADLLPPLDLIAREQLHRFRRDWPDFQALERYLAIGNSAMARHLADKLVAAHPLRPAGHFAAGRAALLDHRWDAAALAFRAALERSPGSVEVGRELVLALAASGEMDGARAALSAMDDSMEARTFQRLFGPAVAAGDRATLMARAGHLGRVQSCVLEGSQTADRAAAVAELAANYPLDAPILELAARAALDSGQAEFARTLADRSTRLDRQATDGWLVLAELALRAGDHPEAQRTAELARTMAPDSRPALLMLARVLRADNRPAHATLVLRPGCQRWPDDRSLRSLLASSLLQSGEHAAALVELEAAVAQWPGDPVGWFHLGRVAETNGDFDRAKAAYKRALRCADRFDEAREAAALLLARSGNADAARRDLLAMTEEDSGSPFGWRGLGDLDLATRPSEAASARTSGWGVDSFALPRSWIVATSCPRSRSALTTGIGKFSFE